MEGIIDPRHLRRLTRGARLPPKPVENSAEKAFLHIQVSLLHLVKFGRFRSAHLLGRSKKAIESLKKSLMRALT